MIYYTGAGWLVVLGLMFVMFTEELLKAITHNPSITAPRSWWLICGYIVAGMYCIALHFILRYRDLRTEAEVPGNRHTLISIPVRYWSIAYFLLGVIRVYSPK